MAHFSLFATKGIPPLCYLWRTFMSNLFSATMPAATCGKKVRKIGAPIFQTLILYFAFPCLVYYVLSKMMLPSGEEVEISRSVFFCFIYSSFFSILLSKTWDIFDKRIFNKLPPSFLVGHALFFGTLMTYSQFSGLEAGYFAIFTIPASIVALIYLYQEV